MDTTTTNPRPDFCEDYHLTFLDSIRETGKLNMFGAAPYLREVFEDELTIKQAREILAFWMRDDRQSRKTGGAA